MVVDIPTIGTVDFPDTMSKDEVNKAVSEQYDRANPKIQFNPLEQAVIEGAGKPGGAPLPSYREEVPAEMNPEKSAALSPVTIPASMVGKGIGALQEEVERQGWEWMNRMGIPTGTQPGESLAPPSALDERKGVLPAVNRFTKGLFTPGNLALLPFAGEKAVQGAFAAGSAAAIPESVQQFLQAQTPEEKRDAATSALLNAGVAAWISRGLAKEGSPNAKAIRGDAGQVQGAGDVGRVREIQSRPDLQQPAPAQPSGTQGAPAPAQTQVLLSDEENAYLENERKGMDVPVEVSTAPSENEPFARGQIATINRRNGSIVVQPAQFQRWLQSVPAERRALAVKSLLNEERLHLANTDDEANDYLRSLSPLERRIAYRRYAGPTGLEGDVRMGKTELAHEALRYRQQQLSRMTPREIAEAALRERWTIKGLDAVDAVIRKTREVFGGEKGDNIASAILDRMQKNSAIARDAISPSATQKKEPFDYSKLSQAEKVEYSYLHNQAMEARQAHEHLPNDQTADTLIDAELALQRFENEKPDLQPSARFKDLYKDYKDADEQRLEWARKLHAQADKDGVSHEDASELFSLINAYVRHPDISKILQRVDASPELTKAVEQLGYYTDKSFGILDKAGPGVRADLMSTRYSGGQGQPNIGPDFSPSARIKAHNDSAERFVTTPEFSKWSGGDVLKDKSGAPMLVYHGSPVENIKEGEIKTPAFFTPKESLGRSYMGLTDKLERYGQLYPAFIKFKNPFIWKEYAGAPVEEVRKLFSQGYDAVVNEANHEYAVKDPSQVKFLKDESGQKELPLGQDFEPSGRIKKGKFESRDQGTFFLPPPVAAVGEKLAPEERTGAVEHGALPPVSASELEQHAARAMALDLTKKGAPKFSDFVEVMQGKMPGIKAGQLTELWQKSIFDWVTHASGEDLTRMMEDIYGKEHIKGRQKIPDAPSPAEEELLKRSAKVTTGDLGNIPPGTDLQTVVREAQQAQKIQEGRRTKYQAGETVRSQYAKRQKAIADIAFELIDPKLRETDLRRKELSPDDLRYGGGKEISAHQEFSQQDANNPHELGRLLVDDARRSSKDPVSATKRVTALMDRRTKKVHLVSTFEDGRRGTVLYDPGLLQHTPLESILKRYRVLSSDLLDEPVQNFHKSFESMDAFNKEWGNEVRFRMDAENRYIDEVQGQQGKALSEEQYPGEIEGTPGLEGEGGHLQGPEARVVAPTARGQVQESGYNPITDTEAAALSNHITDELGGEPDSPEDIWHLLKDLAEGQKGGSITSGVERKPWDKIATFQGKPRPERLKMWLEGPGRAAMSALQKVAKQVQREFPRLSKDELVDKLAKRLYEDKNLETSVAKSKAQFSSKTIPFPRPEPGTTGTEISSIRSRAPTVREGIEPPKGAGPEPQITASTPEKLTERQQRSIARQARWAEMAKPKTRETFDYGPWSKEMQGIQHQGKLRYWNPSEGTWTDYPDPNYKEAMRLYQPADAGTEKAPIFPESYEPSARIKEVKEGIQDDYNNLIKRVVNLWRTSDVKKEMAETGDGMENNADGRGESAKREIISSSEESPKEFGKMSLMERFKARQEQARLGKLRRRAARAVVAALEKPPTETPDRPSPNEAFNKANKTEPRQQGATETGPVQGTPLSLPANASPAYKRFFENWLKQRAKGLAPSTPADMAPVVNPAKFTEFMEQINKGEREADTMMQNPKTRRAGRARKEAAIRLREEVQYAMDNWQTDPALQRTVETIRNELDDHFEWMKASGSMVTEKENYFPNLYKSEFLKPEAMDLGENQILGAQYWSSKKMQNYYEAISKGAYIPASDDPADIVAHHIRNTARAVNKSAWLFSLTDLEEGGKPMAQPAKLVPMQWVTDQSGRKVMTKFRWESPSPQYKLMEAGNDTKPIAVRTDVAGAVEAMMERSAVKESWPVAKALLRAQDQIRHGAILVADTYHPFRGMQLAASMGFGERGGWSGGHSALIYRNAEELARAVELGHISESAAKWATQTIDTGIPGVRNRMDLVKYAATKGLNAVKFSDSIYKDVVRQMRLPGMPIGEGIYKVVGPFNRWLFDRFLPGLVVDGFVTNFEKMRKANPEMRPNDIVRDVLSDMNTRYGSRGRQGIFRNKTAKSIGQMVFLAPAWQEGLIASELKTIRRLAGAPFKAASLAAGEAGMVKTSKVLGALSGRAGKPQLGALGGGVVKGLAVYFALAQAINMITRGHSTFENEEEGHKLDAFIPTGGDKEHGLWLSPLSVFAETTHDLMRVYETRKDPWDTITQIGENKLGPFGRMAVVLASGLDPRTHEHIDNPWRRAGTALSQLKPVPISFGPMARQAGHAIAPGMVKPNEPGTAARQLIASVAGVKTEIAASPVQQMQRLATQFKKSTGHGDTMDFVPTDEPSYSRLRHAIQIGDDKTAKQTYAALRQSHSEHDINKAMHLWARRPLTGSHKLERAFIHSMNGQQRDIYSKAQSDKMKALQQFNEWIVKQP